MAVDPAVLRQLDEVLRKSKQVLVEVTTRTRWERPDKALPARFGGRVPTSGYALASATLSSTRYEKNAYVTDVNHDHKWRALDGWYPDMATAARALGVYGLGRRPSFSGGGVETRDGRA